jgi:hypothetical protein
MSSEDSERPRTFNTDTRQPWNSVIHHTLKAIDLHTKFFLDTQEVWHEQKAQELREYVASLKDWIHDKERTKKLNLDKR